MERHCGGFFSLLWVSGRPTNSGVSGSGANPAARAPQARLAWMADLNPNGWTNLAITLLERRI
jgi:hypothetical protein